MPVFAMAQGNFHLSNGTLHYESKAYPEENMRKDVKPGDNFMQFAAGNWLKTHPLKDNELYNGAFRTCQDTVSARMGRMLFDLMAKPQTPGSTGEYLSILYKQYSDTAQRNLLGTTPMEADLQAIRWSKDKEELQKVMARLYLRGGGTSLFSWDIRADRLHADSNIVAIDRYGWGINPRFFHERGRKFKEVRKAYLHFGQKLFESAGDDSITAVRRMNRVFAIEKTLNRATYIPFWNLPSLMKNRDIEHSVHKMSRADLVKTYKEIDWDAQFLTADGPMDVRQVDVSEPEVLEQACNVLSGSDLEDLKSWAEFRLLFSFAPLLTQSLRREYMAMQSAINGLTADKEQWRVNADFMSNNLSMQMGQLYCERYFSKEQKQRIQLMVDNIVEAFRHRLMQNTWMTDKTKKEALSKLDNIVWQIGFPDEWQTIEGLQISKKNSLYENFARLGEYRRLLKIRKCLNQPVDRHEWTNAPQVVNAYNIWGMNSVCIPAGILQGSFFDPDADEAINYGAIGTVIAHELTHGYDPIGCQVDSIGNVRTWWTSRDKRAFNRRTRVLRRYFSKLKCGGEKVDGSRTLSENVADNGSLQIAFEAMKRAGVENTIDGQTAAQRFFLGYARSHACNLRPRYLWNLVHFDSHAPDEIRINGALPHIDAWYDAFGINPSDSLYLSPQKRASIW